MTPAPELDEILINLLGEKHRHVCPAHQGENCINCRGTGMDQTPCSMCDEDGIAFKRRNKVKSALQTLIAKREVMARWDERNIGYRENNIRMIQLDAELAKLNDGGDGETDGK